MSDTDTDWRAVAANDILGYADLMARLIQDHGVDRAVVVMNQTLDHMGCDYDTMRSKYVVALWQLVVAHTDIPDLEEEDDPDNNLGPDDPDDPDDDIEPEPGFLTRMWRGLWS